MGPPCVSDLVSSLWGPVDLATIHPSVVYLSNPLPAFWIYKMSQACLLFPPGNVLHILRPGWEPLLQAASLAVCRHLGGCLVALASLLILLHVHSVSLAVFTTRLRAPAGRAI